METTSAITIIYMSVCMFYANIYIFMTSPCTKDWVSLFKETVQTGERYSEVQTCSCKMNVSQEWNVQCGEYSQ